MLSVRDRVLPVKLASERALIHVLKVTSDSDGLLHSVLDEIDRDGGLSCGVTVRGVSDYVKRVIRKIADVESDTEES